MMDNNIIILYNTHHCGDDEALKHIPRPYIETKASLHMFQLTLFLIIMMLHKLATHLTRFFIVFCLIKNHKNSKT